MVMEQQDPISDGNSEYHGDVENPKNENDDVVM